jgi:uncharacterized protein (DUF1501 family)
MQHDTTASETALLLVFLRGGADGLALVPPHADDRLYELRPSLADAHPGKSDSSVIDLDGRFGFAPSFGALEPAFSARELAVVHAVGTDDRTRSHFEAQDRLELSGESAGQAAGGFLARHLSVRPGPRAGALAAVALGARAPESLRGAACTAALRSADLGLGFGVSIAEGLGALYANERRGSLPLASDLGDAAIHALEVEDRIADLARSSGPRTERYPKTRVGGDLAEAAFLLRHRRELGVEVVTVDHQGYDTHFGQSAALAAASKELADALAAIRADLDEELANVVVVVMTEFGRRAYENVSLGTDHGRASFMLVLGGAVAGGRVLGDFPGLEEAALEPPGDLAVTTDARCVLAEVLEGALGNSRTDEVFPGAPKKRLGLFR